MRTTNHTQPLPTPHRRQCNRERVCVRRALTWLSCLFGFALAASSQCAASTVTLDGWYLSYIAAAGEPNNLIMDVINGVLVIKDTGVTAIDANPNEGFTQESPAEVKITATQVKWILIHLLDLDDQAQLTPNVNIGCEFYGGDGNDTMTGGARYNVFLWGDGGWTWGNDTFIGGSGFNGLGINADLDMTLTDTTLTAGPWSVTFSGIRQIDWNGGPGNNVMDASAVTASSGFVLLFYGKDGDDTLLLGDCPQIVFGDGGSDRLIGPDLPNTWHVSSADAGTVGGATFTGIENLTGGTEDDEFIFANGAGLSGRIDGNTGTDTLDWSQSLAAPVASIAGSGTLDGSRGTASNLGGGFDNIENLLGSTPPMVFDGFHAPIGGRRFQFPGDSAQYLVIRLNNDGSADRSFRSIPAGVAGTGARTVRGLRSLPDGRLVAAGEGAIRLLPDGTLDGSFTPPIPDHLSFSTSSWMALLSGGRLLLGGNMAFASPPITNRVVCLNGDGTLNVDFILPELQSEVYLLGAARQPGRGLLAWGEFDRLGQVSQPAMVRVRSDGTLDATFRLVATNGTPDDPYGPLARTNIVVVRDVQVLPDGRFYAVVGTGDERIFPYLYETKRFLPDGSPDPTFPYKFPNSSFASGGSGLKLWNDRLIYWSNTDRNVVDGKFPFGRLLPSGAEDPSFVPFTNRLGRLETGAGGSLVKAEVGSFRVVAVDAAGGMIASLGTAVAGDLQNRFGFQLIRLKADGSRDAGFVSGSALGGPGYQTYPVLLNPITGQYEQVLTVYPGWDPFLAAALLPDGGLVAGGLFDRIGTLKTTALAKLDASGKVDAAFKAKVSYCT